MTIYFVRAGNDGPVKIGRSSSPDINNRVSALQVGHHEELHLLRTVDGDSLEEKWLHDFYKDRVIRGEWFEFCESMLNISPPSLPQGEPSLAVSDLINYLTAEQLTYTAFAGLIDRSVATVSRVARGEQIPDPDTMQAIRQVTGGRVQPNSFYPATEGAA